MISQLQNLASSIVSNATTVATSTVVASSSERLPIYFLSHGSPMWAIEKNQTSEFFEVEGKSIAALADKYEGIVVVSAHWENRSGFGTPGVKVTAKDGNLDLIYDFYGFPKQMYEIKYPVAGSAVLADKVFQAVKSSGIKIEKDVSRGVDHGFWVPLRKMIDPALKIPMVQLSLAENASYDFHLNLGKALGPLVKPDPASGRTKGILFIASGSSVHNLRAINFNDINGPPDAWAKNFDDRLVKFVAETPSAEYCDKWADFVAADTATLKKAHPSVEHLMPLVVALGIASGAETQKAAAVHRHYYSNLSATCLR
ncbi:hypothetical protein HK100_003102, partial [Physocladia obscura]